MPLKLQIGLKDNQEAQARDIPNMKNKDNASTKAQHTLTLIQELKSKMEKELNIKVVDKKNFI